MCFIAFGVLLFDRYAILVFVGRCGDIWHDMFFWVPYTLNRLLSVLVKKLKPAVTKQFDTLPVSSLSYV